jgi:hypothetical protein
MILKNTSMACDGYPGPFRVERPKIIKCAATGQYVMWWHLDTESFALRSVGVATAPAITGPWTFLSCFHPDGLDSYDMGLYLDPDGAAYLVRSVANQFAGISQLTADFTNTTGIISRGPQIEGQAIFRVPPAGTGGGGASPTYFLWGSHLTGWAPNPAVLSVANASALNGAAWGALGNPSNASQSGASTTFNSQSTFVLPYVHPDGRVLYVYMGDRWNADGPGGLQNATVSRR